MVVLAERTSTTRRSGVVVTATRGQLDIVAPAAGIRRGAATGAPADGLAGTLAAGHAVELLDAFDVDTGAAIRGGARPRSGVVGLSVPGGGLPLVVVRHPASGLWHWRIPDGAGPPVAGEPASFTVAVEPAAPARRGLVGHVAGRIASFVVCRIADELLERGMAKLAEVFEGRYRRGGLRWFGPGDHRRACPDPGDQFSATDAQRLGSGPSLLFLHDVFALSHTGFHGLPADLLGRLGTAYDGRVWAFDHHTMTLTPQENAAALVDRLARLGAGSAPVDVIAHGRGGLVARELVERAPAGSPLAVRSVAFVATPNAGTPLADAEHLGQLVDRFTNLLAIVPDNPVTDVVDALAVVVGAVAARAIEGLVGVAALDPTGAYLRELDAAVAPPGITYRAVVADFAPRLGANVGERLANLAADRFFGHEPNDLVVPVASTVGTGARRIVGDGAIYRFGPTDGVHHQNFFDRPELDRCFAGWFASTDAPAGTGATARAPRTSRARKAAVTAPSSSARSALSEREPRLDPVQAVVIRAVHGSLECASHHVVVGHFLGIPIQGAEAFVDDRLDRRLSARAQLGHYPERIGDSVVVDTPRPLLGRRAGYPPGAVVVGLDRPGELTREKLAATVSAALTGVAVECLEARSAPEGADEEPVVLQFSAVPIGTDGPGAMSIEGSVAALVEAVIAVNDQLYRHDDRRGGLRAWDHVRVGGLEIMELRADRAELVAHAVRRLPDLLQVPAAEHLELRPAQRLALGEGRLPSGPVNAAQAGEWQRVIIRDAHRERPATPAGPPPGPAAGGAAVLEVTAVGRRARADRMEVTIDDAAIAAMVGGAIEQAAPGDQVGNTLYELLLPAELKSDLLRAENVQIIVDEHTADYPWEALTARLGAGRERELALRGGLLRQFRETEGARRDIRLPLGQHVLMIGNPPAGDDLPSLPGARHEAEAVAALLDQEGFEVRARIRDDEGADHRDDEGALAAAPGRRVLDALFSAEWRIIHVAAHGRFDPDDSSRSGVVIDRGIAITPNVVRQLPVVPELVFLNCCHLGRVTGSHADVGDANRLAASVARELMRIGVRAVVAAGWAVDDDAAVVFAETFYARMGAGELFGTAVHQARRQVREQYPSSMTWAAFQCYGDPGYALRSFHAEGSRAAMPVSPDELVRRVQTVSVLAAKIGLPDFAELTRLESDLVTELDGYRDRLDEWRWNGPAVLFELGFAYGELGRYREAVDCYRRAWADPAASTAPLRLLEQLGSLETRLAQRLHRGPDAGGAEETVAALAASASHHLALALALGDTGERLALMASFHKKMAAMSDGEECQRHLVAACDHYRRAHEWFIEARRGRHTGTEADDADLDLGADLELRPYYTLNWLQLASLAGRPLPAPEAELLLGAIEAAPACPTVPASALPSSAVPRPTAAAGPTATTGATTTSGAIRAPTPGTTPSATSTEESAASEIEEDFWARVTLVDLALTRAVLDHEADLSGLEARYRAAFRTRSSRRDRDSVIDHLRDIADLRSDPDLGLVADRLDDRNPSP